MKNLKQLLTKSFYILVVFLLFTYCAHKKEETTGKKEQIKTASAGTEQTATKQVAAEQSSELFKTIAKMDSLYFSAQNACDLKAYASFLSEDFEFFHDKGGFTDSKKSEMAGMAIFCGKEQRSRQPLRREIKKKTLRVYPMDKYGALEFCEHVFYLQINDGTEKVVGSGKMTALWKQENDEWKLTRVISYDHQPLAKVELAAEVLDQYVGDYKLPDRIVNIKREGKLLRVTDINDGKPGWTKELFPESENTFYLNYENNQFEFVRNGNTIEMVKIYENGKLIEKAKRQ
ncbi:hypothetical protein BKI52_34900 [marine bacterium AO1-C]|nr:hypothetical protein BKI52_34900 [marine bacterium AO1-C]